MRALTALLLVLATSPGLPAGAGAAAGGEAWLSDLPEAVRRSEASGKPILVDLYAEWCSWCKVLEKEVFASPSFQEFARDYVLLRVDTEDGAQGTSLYLRFGAVSLPTTLVIDNRLALIASVEGYAPTPTFLRQLQQALGRHSEYLGRVAQAARPETDATVRRAAVREARERADGARAAPLLEMLAAASVGEARRADLADLADAYRLDRRFDEARRAAGLARQEATAVQDGRNLERADLLLAAIAQESGDCGAARLAFESFVQEHPRSSFVGHAKRVLKAIAEDRSGRCA